MKPINLYWFKLKDGSSNYGDELNHFIVKELSDRPVVHIPYPYRWHKVLLVYLNNLIRKRGYVDFPGMIRSLFAKEVLFAIGSILHIYDRKGVIVWGSGIIKKDAVVFGAIFKAVRGQETVNRLRELGYNIEAAMGDPALLLPFLISVAPKRHKVGIVPNFIHYDELSKRFTLPTSFTLIDLKGDIQTVTDEITSCEYVIATSLHGVIVAQAYGIPALWVDFNLNSKLAGDDVKFRDYFSSVNIEPYKPYVLDGLSYDEIKELMDKNPDQTLINGSLKDIQKNLLMSFPFSLKNKYKSFEV